MGFDHVGLAVSNLDAAVTFYTTILSPLGYKVIKEIPTYTVGFGDQGIPDFWVGAARDPTKVGTLAHIAFKADSEEQVKEVYDIAIKAGAKDNGPPGPRPHYHPGYYGAFFFDSDGNNIEIVFRGGATYSQ